MNIYIAEMKFEKKNPLKNGGKNGVVTNLQISNLCLLAWKRHSQFHFFFQ